MTRLFPTLLLPALVLVLAGCGGGGSSGSSPATSSSSSSSSAPLVEVNVKGVVSYGSPLANADVTFTAGSTSATAKTDSTGKYSLTFKAPAADASKLVKAVARGTGAQAEIELASLLPSLNVLVQQAGSDKLLESSENFDVNITNITTAQYGLLGSDFEADFAALEKDLDIAKFMTSAQSKMELAALIKIIIDTPEYNLPNGVATTLALMASDDVDELQEFVEDHDSALLQSTIAAFASDAILVKPANNNLSQTANISDASLARCLNQTGAAGLAEVLFLNCEQANVVSLAGLENLTNLRGLNIADNSLANKVLDVSQNPKLEALDASGNDLTSVNLQANIGLTHLSLADNQLKTIDVSKNPKLDHLVLDDNQIAALDIHANTKLQLLALNNNLIKILDVTSQPDLRQLWAYGLPIAQLDLSKNTRLTQLALQGQTFDKLDLSQNSKLELLVLWQVPVTSLNTSNMTELKGLYLYHAKLTSLDITNNKKLSSLFVVWSDISQLNLSQQAQLTSLTLRDNELDTLDLSKNTLLKSADLQSNGLTSISGLENIADKSVEVDLWYNPLSDQTIQYLFGLEDKGFTDLSFDPSPSE